MADSVLVRRALDGEDRAFTALVDRHAGACLRFATRMLGSREDAEDATQEALLRAYRALATYDDSTSFRTWLFAILVNRCRTTLLRRSRRLRRVLTDDEAVSRAASTSEARSVELREELSSALERLDADQREAFLLKHVEQLGYEEMATITGASISALKMRVKRACARLQDLLREESDVRP